MKKINNFWNWFLDNQYTIKNLMNHTAENQDSICYWIKQNLSYYCPEIDFFLLFPNNNNNNNNKTEFIITTNENSSTFKKAIALIDKAPVMKDWKLTVLLKSKTIEKRLNKLHQPYVIHDINLKIDKVEHIPINPKNYSKKQTIHIHLKNHTICCSNKTFEKALFFILEEILANAILYENISIVQLSQNAEEEISVIHLYELQQYMDN